MFQPGQAYSRREIHDEVGGSIEACMPTLQGTVVAVCLQQQKNPGAPQVILCGDSPAVSAAGLLLATQERPVPVFVKERTNRWSYRGLFRSSASYTSGSEFDAHVGCSSRAPSTISRVIVLSDVEST